MAAAWQKPSNISSVSASGHRIATIAARQLGFIRSEQLREIGLPPSTIRSRVASGRLFRVHQGVYSLVPPPYSRDQLWLAAVLACGPGAMLSHQPAAMLQGFLDRGPARAQVTVATGRGRTRPGITVHRAAVDTRDRRKVEQIPCTSADRVLIDLAPACEEAELEAILVAAESLGLIKRSRLAELIAEHRGRPGIHRLESVTALEPVHTRSLPETSFLAVCRIAGVPRPKVNHPIQVPTQRKPLIVDFAWPDVRLVVEVDSQRFHGDWEVATRDRERDQALALAGWVPHRFVRALIVAQPEPTARRLGALYALRLG
jgi:hypothetical protein